MSKAIFIKETSKGNKLYKLDLPLYIHYIYYIHYKYYEHPEDHVKRIEYVLISDVSSITTNETFIFNCDAHGTVTDYNEIPGSFRDGIYYPKTIKGLGYTMSEQ